MDMFESITTAELYSTWRNDPLKWSSVLYLVSKPRLVFPQINVSGREQMKRLSGSVRLQECLAFLLIWRQNRAESTLISSPSFNLNRCNYRNPGVFGRINTLHTRAQHHCTTARKRGVLMLLERIMILFFFLFFFELHHTYTHTLRVLRCTSFHESLCRLSKMK